MNNVFKVFLLLLVTVCCSGQEVEKVTLKIEDTWDLYVNDGESKELHYLKLASKKEAIGALVILPSGFERTNDVLKQIELHKRAAENGIVVIVPSINWGTDDRKAEFEVLNIIFEQVTNECKIPKGKFILGGLSNGGMIALAYAEKTVKNPELNYLRPIGVFGLDTPLDEAHLYEYAERELKRNFSDVGMAEAKLFLENYNKTYGGSPKEFPDKYIEASIYSYASENGGNAKYLKDMPIRMYTDLDVEWLMNERHRDLYDWNGTDIVAMVNQLKVLGNTDANVKISQGKGFRLDGTKHPHSWSILDTEDCLKWIIKLFE